MIAKHVPMRSVGKSDFAGLVSYITDAQNKDHRLGAVRLSNCDAATHSAAIEEVLATQLLNTRATSDKTYHLLLSFRAGEQPTPDALNAIEDRICAGLGFAEHQRISAVHNDTDNLHIHIAINKVHPTHSTVHEPYQAYRTLAELCAVLERDYGLEPDNHTPRQRVSENKANDMERHAGIESLVGWIKRECLGEIRSARSWSEFHEVMQANGLQLRERANGFVIEAEDGTQIKASTVARDFSKPKLESRFGPFESSTTEPSGKTQRSYRKEPVRLRVNTTELYAKYKAEQSTLTKARADALMAAKHRKDRAIAEAKRNNKLRRATIKVLDGKGINKKVLYAQASLSLRTSLKTIHNEYAKESEKHYKGFQRCAWADWLKQQAIKGDVEALTALRAREATHGLKGNTVQATGNPQPANSGALDNITKKGTIIYRAGSSAVRDDGDKLQISRNATKEGLQAALRIAMERYGNRITVNGTAEFKAQVIRAAANSQLPITFADPGLERRRLDLMKEKTHDHTNRGRSDRRGNGRTGPGTVANQHTTRPVGRKLANVRTAINGKPNIGRIGRVPPPQSQHHLRKLSELGVVRITSGSEMLLPRDVPRHLEQQGTQSNHELRRDLPRTRVKPEATTSASDKYIAERESKRLKGFDIPKHCRYTDGNGPLIFAGTRTIDDQPLALLRRGDGETVMVMAIDNATARHLSRISIGDSVSVTPSGSIKTKGRSR